MYSGMVFRAWNTKLSPGIPFRSTKRGYMYIGMVFRAWNTMLRSGIPFRGTKRGYMYSGMVFRIPEYEVESRNTIPGYKARLHV
jgi:hypothetical protein